MTTMRQRALSPFLASVGLVASALGIGIVGCGSNDSLPVETYPPVVIQLSPDRATVTVGDSTRLEGQITGGNPLTPPLLERCTASSPNIATVIRSATACTVVGVTPGTTDIIVMASTGHVDTAAVVVVAR